MIHLLDIARATALAGVVSGCIALSAPAFAADSDVPQGTIDVRNADLASPRGVAHLKEQVRRVAMDICTADGHPAIFMSPEQHRCFETALRDGLQQVDSRQEQAMRARPVQLAEARSAINLGD